MNKKLLTIIFILIAGLIFYGGLRSKSAIFTGNAITPAPTPVVPFALQRQCGIDARDFIKQFNGTQTLSESSYSTKLQSCIAYTENNPTATGQSIIDSSGHYIPSSKTIYNVSTNNMLGGYIYTAQTSTYTYDSDYWLNNSEPAKQSVSLEEYNNYLKSLGLTSTEYRSVHVPELIK
jgi:hypothetical protein